MSVTTKIIRWVLPFLALSAQAEPLYWNATKGKLSLTIIGSVHVGDPSMYPLPKTIYQALYKSDGLIVESDTSNQEDIEYPLNSLTTEEVLSKEQLVMLDKITSELNINHMDFHQLPPWSTALSLQFLQLKKLGFVSEDGVDVHLMEKASSKHIPLVPLESMQFQIDLLTTQPDDGKELLTSILEEWDENKNMTQCLIKSWKAGDANNLEKMMQLSEMSPEMEKTFVHDRNQDWVQKLSSGHFLPNPSGQYVMIVGALHLVGKGNVIELLEKKGFKVKPLNRSQKANCSI